MRPLRSSPSSRRPVAPRSGSSRTEASRHGHSRHTSGTKPAQTCDRFADTVTPGGLVPPWGARTMTAGAEARERPEARQRERGRAREPPAAGARSARVSRLHVHAWGDEDAPPVVCLHGVTGSGRHFERLAGRLAPAYRVAGPRPARPRRLTARAAVAARRPRRRRRGLRRRAQRSGSATRSAAGSRSSTPRVVPAPSSGSSSSTRRSCFRRTSRSGRPRTPAASGSTRASRPRSTAATRRASSTTRRARSSRPSSAHHMVEDEDGWRYRYTQACVVTAYSEMATSPPSFADVRVPTLLVLGADSTSLRPPARRAPRRARRPARGRHGAGRPHGAVGCARRDGRRGRELPGPAGAVHLTASAPSGASSRTRPRSRAPRRGSQRPRPPRRA